MKNGFKLYMETIELPDEDAIQQVIKASTELYTQKQPHASYFEFLFSQLMFLKTGIWLKQLLCLVIGFGLTYFCYVKQLALLARVLLSLIPILIHVVSMPYLMKSIDTHTLELEQATYFRYRDTLITKLWIIGLINICFISILMFMTYGLVSLSFEQLLLYTLVPYNITCCISLIVMLWVRNDHCIFTCMVMNILLSICLFLCSNTQLYIETAYLYIWKWMLLASIVILVLFIYMVLRKADDQRERRSELLWN